MIINEQMSRQRFEHEMRAEVDKRWEVLKTLTEDEMTSLRDSIQVRISHHTAHARPHPYINNARIVSVGYYVSVGNPTYMYFPAP